MNEPRAVFLKTLIPIAAPDQPGFVLVCRRTARYVLKEGIGAMMRRLAEGGRGRGRRRHGAHATSFNARWARAKERRKLAAAAEGLKQVKAAA